jgi:hypothetical protein
MASYIRTDYYIPTNIRDEGITAQPELPEQGTLVSAYTVDTICAVRKFLIDEYGYNDRIPTVKEFCERIVNEHIEREFAPEERDMVSPDDRMLMLRSGTYCVALQRLGRVHNQEMVNYANTRSGSWIYIDSPKWNGREPSFEELFVSNYVTFRVMLDTLQFMNTLETLVNEGNY